MDDNSQFNGTDLDVKSDSDHGFATSISDSDYLSLDSEFPSQSQHPPIDNPSLANRLPTGFGFMLLRWPLLIFIFTVMSMEVIFYLNVRIFVNLQESVLLLLSGKRSNHSRSVRILQQSTTYDQYRSSALSLDELCHHSKWKSQESCAYYDFRLIQRITRNLDSGRRTAMMRPGDHHAVKQLKRILTSGALKSNIGGIENPLLYSQTFYGTKVVVEKYLEQLEQSVDFVQQSPCLSDEQKHSFFRKATKMFGRTALCLSGGATFGYFHLGVVKALLERNCLPEVIAGTSAGSLIAAFVCVRTDEELLREINGDLYVYFTACDIGRMQMIKNFCRYGACFDPDHWIPKLQWATKGDLTFSEAYALTGRILNITVISEREYSPPKLLNYKTAPDILINSAVLASSAVPGILPKIQLLRKLADGSIEPYVDEGEYWRDGSLRIDIPLTDLHQMFQVNFSIVSQVNPHITVFFFENKGSVGMPHFHRQGRGWRGGFVLSSLEHALKLDLKKWLKILRDLQLLPIIHSQNWSFVFLQKFDGSVTIVPHISLSDYRHILTDPCRQRMERYIDIGMHCTWPKMKIIENRHRIEQLIWKSYRKYRGDSSNRNATI